MGMNLSPRLAEFLATGSFSGSSLSGSFRAVAQCEGTSTAKEKSFERPAFPSFEFVDDEELLEVPVLMPESETTFQKFQRKFKEEPLVPLGFLTTAGVLTAGLWTFKQGNNPAKAQRLMRYRVLAQGFT